MPSPTTKPTTPARRGRPVSTVQIADLIAMAHEAARNNAGTADQIERQSYTARSFLVSLTAHLPRAQGDALARAAGFWHLITTQEAAA